MSGAITTTMSTEALRRPQARWAGKRRKMVTSPITFSSAAPITTPSVVSRFAPRRRQPTATGTEQALHIINGAPSSPPTDEPAEPRE
jgi:hypothetical protein